MKKKMTYKQAVEWVALNDEPTLTILDEVEVMVSTLLIADIWAKAEKDVALDIVRLKVLQGNGR